MIELTKLFVSTINEILAINACITVGGTKEHCQTTTEFSKEAEDLQGTRFSRKSCPNLGQNSKWA